MLICPQCGFENPRANKFCQRCGTSLTHRTCPACGAEVSVERLDCQACGATVGTVLWAALARRDGGELTWTPAEDAPAAATERTDPYQRYQSLGAVNPAGNLPGFGQTRVLDRNPYQMRFLDRLLESHGGDEGDAETDAADGATDEGDEAALEAVLNQAIPAIAHPYLTLEPQFGQQLPEVYDTWQQDGQEVVLLEDRSDWMGLVDLWANAATPVQQILNGFHEMLELWEVLAPLNCCASLLEIDNLRADEDQALALQQLHAGSEAEPPLLKDLGRAWLTLLKQSGRDRHDPLVALCRDAIDCELLTVDEARSRLRSLFQQLDAEGNATAVPSAAAAPAPASPAGPAAAAPEAPPPIQPEMLAGDDDDEVEDAPTVVLPMQLASLGEAGRTDIGRQRNHNEDCFGIYTELRKQETPMGRTVQARNLYVLCDGMGGHAGGEVASELAVKTLYQYFQAHWHDALPSAEEIRDAILEANRAIFQANQREGRSGSGRMGTTLVLVLVHNSQVAIGHVGDSRLYRLSRRRGLEQLTVDHEVGQREIQHGIDPDAAYSRPDAYQLTQALGPRDDDFVEPDIQFFELDEDMLLLMCTDGLTDNDLVETHWQTHLAPLLSSRANLDQGVTQLVELANQHNGHDNITVVAIRAKVQPNMAFIH